MKFLSFAFYSGHDAPLFRLYSTFTQLVWHLFCSISNAAKKQQNVLVKLEMANHPRGWDAKPLVRHS
jgi:hypothetical protein